MATSHSEENIPSKTIKILIGPSLQIEESRCHQKVSSEA